MPTTAAQDEFDALVSRNTARASRHRADSSSSASSTSSPPPPGRRTPALRNGRTSHDIDDDDDDNDDTHDSATAGRGPAATNLPRRGPAGANTGPKGVIADARAYEAARRRARMQGSADADAGADGDDGDDGAGRHWTDGARRSPDAASPDPDSDADADSTFLSTWRARRIAQLSAPRPPAPPTGLRAVTGPSFLSAVDGAEPGQSVVVYIPDAEGSSLGIGYAAQLDGVARRCAAGGEAAPVWISLDAETAEVDEAGLPALLVYRDGEKVAGWVPLRDEVPFTCNVTVNLETALRRVGVLPS